jgi:hypothetical protein
MLRKEYKFKMTEKRSKKKMKKIKDQNRKKK